MRLVIQRRLPVALMLVAMATSAAFAQAEADRAPTTSTGDLKRLSMEQLLDVEVTSVLKRPQKLSDTASAIQVITHDDIQRSGATSLPEALRLVANLQVARIDPVQYAVSARGFNNAVGNKLLVLIDGRTVYTPLFSGVFWEQQDVMLEDVERIEVISGPGAALWGANAVNGVINVVTWPAQDTQGLLVAANGGSDERGLALRYGGALGAEDAAEAAHYRVYAKATGLENTTNASGTALRNSWDRIQAGFRTDWNAANGMFTVQGDVYDGRSEHRGFAGAIEIPETEVSGANVLARWSAQLEDDSDVRIQAYLDHAERDEAVVFRPKSDIFDLELQHGFSRGAHRLLWGGGYRHARDDARQGLLIGFIPSSRDLNWVNLFIQDQIAVTESLRLTGGIKLEHNDYTGMEYLPTIRIAWEPDDQSLLWGRASRAVRAPSRLDRDVVLPPTPPFLIRGGPDFESEVANVVELGYRAQPVPALSWSLTMFHHDWDELRSGQQVPGVLENRIEGSVYGAEAQASWQIARAWRISAGVTGLREELRLEAGSTDPVGVNNPNLANDPEYQWTVRSSWRIANDHDIDVFVRRVDDLPNPRVPDYTAVNVRYAWRLRPKLEISITGTNVSDGKHAEFGSAASRSVYERGLHGKILWGF